MDKHDEFNNKNFVMKQVEINFNDMFDNACDVAVALDKKFETCVNLTKVYDGIYRHRTIIYISNETGKYIFIDAYCGFSNRILLYVFNEDYNFIVRELNAINLTDISSVDMFEPYIPEEDVQDYIYYTKHSTRELFDMFVETSNTKSLGYIDIKSDDFQVEFMKTINKLNNHQRILIYDSSKNYKKLLQRIKRADNIEEYSEYFEVLYKEYKMAFEQFLVEYIVSNVHNDAITDKLVDYYSLYLLDSPMMSSNLKFELREYENTVLYQKLIPSFCIGEWTQNNTLPKFTFDRSNYKNINDSSLKDDIIYHFKLNVPPNYRIFEKMIRGITLKFTDVYHSSYRKDYMVIYTSNISNKPIYVNYYQRKLESLSIFVFKDDVMYILDFLEKNNFFDELNVEKFDEYVKNKKYTNAIDYAASLYNKYPYNEDVIYIKLQSISVSKHTFNEFDKIASDISKIVKNKNINYLCANVYYENNKYQQALPLYKKFIYNSQVPNSFYLEIGDCYFYTNQKEEAVKYYEKALELNSCNEEVYKMLLVYYKEKEDTEKLIFLYSKLIETDEGVLYKKRDYYQELHSERAQLYIKINDFGHAVNDLCIARELFKKNGFYINPDYKHNFYIGMLLLIAGEYNKGIKEIIECLNSDRLQSPFLSYKELLPNDIDFELFDNINIELKEYNFQSHVNIARIYHFLERYELAITHFIESHKINKTKQSLYLLAECYERINELDKAIVVYDELSDMISEKYDDIFDNFENIEFDDEVKEEVYWRDFIFNHHIKDYEEASTYKNAYMLYLKDDFQQAYVMLGLVDFTDQTPIEHYLIVCPIYAKFGLIKELEEVCKKSRVSIITSYYIFKASLKDGKKMDVSTIKTRISNIESELRDKKYKEHIVNLYNEILIDYKNYVDTL